MAFFDPEPAVVPDLSVVAQLTALMEFIPIGIVIAADPQCATMWANRAAQGIFRTQYSASLFSDAAAPAPLKAGFRAFREGVEIARDELPLQRAVRANRGVSAEHEILLEDGVLLHVVISAAPLRTAAGEVTGGIAAITDVTRERRDAALTQLAHECSTISASLDVDEAVRALVALLVRRVADRGEIYLREGDELRLAAVAERDAAGDVHPTASNEPVDGEHPAARALEAEEPLLVMSDEHSAIYTRLATRERTIGSIAMIGRRHGRAFDLNDLSVAKTVAEQAAVELEKSLLYAETRRSAIRMKLLSDVGLAFSRSLEFDERLDAIARSIPAELADIVMVNLVEPDGRIRTVAAWHADPRYREIATAWAGRILIDANSRVGTPAVIRSGVPQLRRFATLDPQTPFAVSDVPLPGRDPRFAIAASLVVPLAAVKGVAGTLVCIKSQPGASYSEDDRSLFVLIGQRAGVAIENAALYSRERRVAMRFQQAQLPERLPAVPGYQLSTIYVPGSHEADVGGDWCDAFQLPNGRVAITMGDVMGSGIDSAIVMAKLRQAMRVGAFLEPTAPRMLDAADFTLREEHPDVFATALAAILDPRTGVLRFVSAGHPLPLLRRRNGALVPMESADPPLGVALRPERRTLQAVMLDAGSLLVCYTDGLIEGRRDALAGEELLREIVAAFEPRAESARDLYRMMNACIPSRDDVAVIAVAAGIAA